MNPLDRTKPFFSPSLLVAFVFFLVSALPSEALEMVNGDKQSSPCPSSGKILIGYYSKYGSTRQYALWLRERIPSDLAELSRDEPDISRYDLVVIGSYVRTGKIAASSFIKKNWPLLREREIILFTVSGTPPDHPALAESYKRSIPSEIRSRMIHHALPGRLIQKDLSLFDKILLYFGRTFEKDEAIRKTMHEDYDNVRRENVLPLISDIQKIIQSRCSRNRMESIVNPSSTDP